MQTVIERIPKTKLFVKPVHRVSYQNRHLQEANVFTSGSVTSKGPAGKIKATTLGGRSCSDNVVFKHDESRIRLLAGMGEAIENPFSELDPEDVIAVYNLSSKWRGVIEKLVKQRTVTRQQYLEILDGVDPDTYTEKVSSRRIGQFFDPNSPKSVLEEIDVRLYDQTNVFDSSSSTGRLYIQAIKSRPDKVAPSLDAVNTGVHNFYIAEEHEEYILSKKKNDLENEAVFELVNLRKNFPDSVLYKIASVLQDAEGLTVVKGETTPLYVEEALNSYIKTNGKYQLRYIDSFLDTVKLFKNNPDLFHIRYVVQIAINNSIFSEGNGYLFWPAKRDIKEHYKFSSRINLENFLFAEMDKYDPDEPAMQNCYGDVLDQLQSKGLKVE